jgi:hypothetical protein
VAARGAESSAVPASDTVRTIAPIVAKNAALIIGMATSLKKGVDAADESPPHDSSMIGSIKPLKLDMILE